MLVSRPGWGGATRPGSLSPDLGHLRGNFDSDTEPFAVNHEVKCFIGIWVKNRVTKLP